jgi:hypothetical protein
MHLFDTTDSGVINARPKFWITTFVLSFATYGISAFGYWGIRSRRYENWRARLSAANGRSALRKSKKTNLREGDVTSSEQHQASKLWRKALEILKGSKRQREQDEV